MIVCKNTRGEPKLTTDTPQKGATQEVVAPFWLVGATVNENEANMTLKTISDGEVEIPSMVNSKGDADGRTKLRIYTQDPIKAKYKLP